MTPNPIMKIPDDVRRYLCGVGEDAIDRCIDGSYPSCGCYKDPVKCCMTYYNHEAQVIINFFKGRKLRTKWNFKLPQYENL